MSKTYCSECNDQLNDDQVRWAFDSPYCNDCFDGNFVNCSHCDALINRSDAHGDDGEESFCPDCFDKEYDDESPRNPVVHDADRLAIIELSRNWLLGRLTKRAPIKVNEQDHHLIKLRDRIGLVENPIYVYGLHDREEYNISASPNLLDQTKEFIQMSALCWKVTEGIGSNRIGIALSIRQNDVKTLHKLIKHLTEPSSSHRA